MALVTLSEYKAYYGIATTTDDVPNQTLINIAEAMITKFCGRSLESTLYTELYDGGCSSIQLEATPVISITSITTGLGEVVTDYTLYKDAGILKSGTAVPLYYTSQQRFIGGMQDLTIVYTAGYATIPEDIKYCVYVLAKKLSTNKVAAATGAVKRQRLHNEDREYFPSASSKDTSQAVTLGNDVVSILRNYL